MNRNILLIIAFLAVFAESLLAPYYPMYFKKVFDIHNADAIGWYIAACRIVFMAAYPIWAIISKRHSLRSILVCTQGLAGCICIACAYTNSYTLFLVLSLLMIFFKASYLLIYPYLIQNTTSRYKEIGLLGIILNVGMITATFVSSMWIEQVRIEYLFLVIGAFDFLQMTFSYYFLLPEVKTEMHIDQNKTEQTTPVFSLIQIGVLTLFLYLLSTTLRPFYTEFILSQTAYTYSVLEAGCLFILPSVSVLIFYFFFRKETFIRSNTILISIVLCFAASVYIQQFEMSFLLICLIRIVYGFLLFCLCVHIDLLFFETLGNTHAALWYGLIHGIQNIAYLLAPLYAGYEIEKHGLAVQFDIAFVFALFFLSVIIVTSISFKSKQHRYESFR